MFFFSLIKQANARGITVEAHIVFNPIIFLEKPKEHICAAGSWSKKRLRGSRKRIHDPCHWHGHEATVLAETPQPKGSFRLRKWLGNCIALFAFQTRISTCLGSQSEKCNDRIFLILHFTHLKYLAWFAMRNSHPKNASNLASLYEP